MSFLEDHLDTPLRDLLPLLQKRMLGKSTWFGIPTLKNPMDFWVYQEIFFDTLPDVIIEVGMYAGGSALAMAQLCENLGHGRVIAMDPRLDFIPPAVFEHPRITVLEGCGADLAPQVKAMLQPDDRVLIIEDSSHTYANTLAVLRAYQDLIQPGQYFIVEDSIGHHGLDQGPNPGPLEAIDTFLAENPDFYSDRERESFVITWNPKGFLTRRSS